MLRAVDQKKLKSDAGELTAGISRYHQPMPGRGDGEGERKILPNSETGNSLEHHLTATYWG